eukprot:TRINITY_DN5365_c0_g1_i1.p1 TRINITY_DN5365_c0_g1~~TRINITY_DN5365_c0_g1_i1.p1  ORF type:complete len:196 (-),score=30.43 TRINITY_DN5365_c0_g1_i1:238-825(-)
MKGRALISVYDKTGIESLARTLCEKGYEIVSTGGTYDKLISAGFSVTKIDTITGFPEILGGRVKTLHPVVHGGILARRSNPSHLKELKTHNITPIDFVICNLYPFEKTLAKQGVTEDELIEQIDIGGVTMLRASAKNFGDVVVVTDVADYERVSRAILDDSVTMTLRKELALKAFQHTLAMDQNIVNWLATSLSK